MDDCTVATGQKHSIPCSFFLHVLSGVMYKSDVPTVMSQASAAASLAVAESNVNDPEQACNTWQQARIAVRVCVRVRACACVKNNILCPVERKLLLLGINDKLICVVN